MYAISPNVRYCDLNGIKKYTSSGRGYPQDLVECLGIVKRYPVLVLPADLYIYNLEALTEAIIYTHSMEDEVITVLQLGQYVGISGKDQHRISLNSAKTFHQILRISSS